VRDEEMKSGEMKEGEEPLTAKDILVEIVKVGDIYTGGDSGGG
jgi:hypothetical protein